MVVKILFYFSSFLCGLVLFLFGIKLMSSTFKKIVSIKLQNNINKISSNKIIGVLIGIIMTGLLQSSSAATLIIISLVHGNLINIYNAVPIIMGTNIGTTFTSQLIAYNMENFQHYLLPIGVILITVKNKRLNVFGKIFLSLSFVFLGIDLISFSLSPLKSSEFLINFIYSINDNKLYGIGVGFLITAIIQSSSTGVTMLQVMASNKLLQVSTALPIILGQNIGTCVDTLVGSLTTNKVGRQTAIIHLLFNIAGVVIMYFFIDKLYSLLIVFTPNQPAKQIANFHTIFNVITTFILLPFSRILVILSKRIVKE